MWLAVHRVFRPLRGDDAIAPLALFADECARADIIRLLFPPESPIGKFNAGKAKRSKKPFNELSGRAPAAGRGASGPDVFFITARRVGASNSISTRMLLRFDSARCDR
ncbi:hypothetical protein EVAR_19858_1 [Eumeta japonica]|uniref:Uncharacterized protein n=1 Tax=Eumeta variegata TaxID=151549 RepID=A0A4C1UQR3_EUMVA|nr:hypothetical protein EVAR_19858_1 [Eumeta japonica]